MKNSNNVSTVAEPKLVREIRQIIEGEGTRKEKLAALRAVNFSGRPGQDDANALLAAYRDKFNAYSDRKITGKFPRGENRVVETGGYWQKRQWNVRTSWYDSFVKHIGKVAPNFHSIGASFFEMAGLDYKEHSTYWNTNFAVLRPFANQIRAKAIEISNKIEAEKQRKREFSQRTGLSEMYFNKEASIESVQKNKADNAYRAENMYCVVNGWNITVKQSVSEDWNAYSKGWHNAHGPKRTIDARWVEFTKVGEKKEIYLNSFAGNYLINAIIEFFNLPPVKPTADLKNRLGKNFKKVQLNDRYEVKFERSLGGYDFYSRSFAGIHQDYCIIDSEGNTFHAATMQACAQGLRLKVDAEFRFENEEITYRTAKSLGFCETGIRNFCEDNGIDIDAAYTRQDLRNIVLKNRSLNCGKYDSELKQLGIVLNCK